VGAGVKTTRHPKRKESGGGKQQTLFPMKSKSKDAEKEEVEVEGDESMIETPTKEMEMDAESEELQEAQAPSIVGDSLVCPSFSLPHSPLLFPPLLTLNDCVVLPSPSNYVSSDS
jgi:hypothetical protein